MTSKALKIRELFANMGWMTISNFASKILIFLMVPFYTRMLTTDGYGLYDLCYTMTLLLTPLVTANMAEALMRFALVEKDKIAERFSTTLVVALVAMAVVLIAGFAIMFFPILEGELAICVIGSCFYLATNILYTLFSQFARGTNHVKDMAFGGLINALGLALFSVLFLAVLNVGIGGCFWACSLGSFLGAVFIALRCKFWTFLTTPSRESCLALAKYGFPLSINTIGWWAYDSLSRFFVAAFCGMAGTGLFAAACKIPAIPKTIQQIFVQAWQISSIKEFDSKDKDGFFALVYNVSGCLSALLASVCTALASALALLMFSSDYFEVWKYIPILMLTVMFNCLSSVIGGVFSAVGNTKPIAASALVSIVVAAICSLVMIPFIGIYGAAIANVLASMSIWFMRMIQARQYIDFSPNNKAILFCFIVLVVQILLSLYLELSPVLYALQLICSLMIFICFLKLIPATKLLKKKEGKSK